METNRTIGGQMTLCAFALLTFAFGGSVFAQTEKPPAPSAPKTVKIPAVQEKALANNGLNGRGHRTQKRAACHRASLLIKSGAVNEEDDE